MAVSASSSSSPTTSSPSPLSHTSTSSSPDFSPSSYFNSLARKRQQKKMSITQTYYLAHTARKKLTREASRADHNLRLLVGHANLLDSLMLDLADAEQEQERWFNQTVSGVTKTSQGSDRRIQWAETVVEEPEEDWDPEDVSDDDSDVSDDSDLEEDDFEPTPVRRRAPSPVAFIREREIEEDYDSDSDSDFEYDDVDDTEELALTRSPSRQSPPELALDSDEDSEDDSMPPSPPQPTLDTFSEKQPQTTTIRLSEADFKAEYYETTESPGLTIEAF